MLNRDVIRTIMAFGVIQIFTCTKIEPACRNFRQLLVSPSFIPVTLNGDNYLDLLENTVHPRIIEIFRK